MQSWVLGVCLRRARAIAKMERMSENETEHFRSVIQKAIETNDLMAPHAEEIRDLIKSKRGEA